MESGAFILTLFLILTLILEEIESRPQAMGSILEPWGGDLGGSWQSPIGYYSSASSNYNNGLGFL